MLVTTNAFDAALIGQVVQSGITPPSSFVPPPAVWVAAGQQMFSDAAGTVPAVPAGALKNWKSLVAGANNLTQPDGGLGFTAQTVSGYLVGVNASSVLYYLSALAAVTQSSFHALCYVAPANSGSLEIQWDFGPGNAEPNWQPMSWTGAVPVHYAHGHLATGQGLPWWDGNWHHYGVVWNFPLLEWVVDGVIVHTFDANALDGWDVLNVRGLAVGAHAATPAAPTSQAHVSIADLSFFPGTGHSGPQIAAMFAYYQATYPALCGPVNRIFLVMSNSLTDGGNFLANDPKLAWPYQCFLGQAWWDRYWNLGIGGATTPELSTWFSSQWHSLISMGITKKVAVIWEGRNDIVTNGASAAVAWANTAALADLVTAAGWEVILIDLLPAADLLEATRTAYNGLAAANFATHAHALVQLSADLVIGQAGQNLSPVNYQADHIHLTAAGMVIVAGDVRPTLAAA